MLTRTASRKQQPGEDSSEGKLLLKDIEVISKALYLDKSPRSRSSASTLHSRSKSAGKTHLTQPKGKLSDDTEEELPHKDKKSIWSWKGLKALTHIRHRKFNCCFSLQVHSIEGLPSHFDSFTLSVHWKRREGELATHPVRVLQGIAKFEEVLTHTCSVYGSRNGSQNSAKYEAKYFLLYVAVFGAPELDLGKHRIDLTRLLPLTLEELEDEKCSGKWTTSFKLSGMAKGASMNVSFGYSVDGSKPSPLANSDATEASGLKRTNTIGIKPVTKNYQNDRKGTIRLAGSVPSRPSTSSVCAEDINDLHEVLPTSVSDLSSSVNILYQKLDEETLDAAVDSKAELDVSAGTLTLDLNLSDSVEENAESEHEDGGFFVTEQGIEQSHEEHVKSQDDSLQAAQGSEMESPELLQFEAVAAVSVEGDAESVSHVKECDKPTDDLGTGDCITQENGNCTKESLMKDLELALHNISDMEIALDSPKRDKEVSNEMKSFGLDDFTDSDANEFLDMLGIEHSPLGLSSESERSPLGLSSESEPESPRERLLRQFEKDALAAGSSLFNFNMEDDFEPELIYEAPTESGSETLDVNLNPSLTSRAAEEKFDLSTQETGSTTRDSMLEDLEIEALMLELGLDEDNFQPSLANSSGGFGSPIDHHPEIPPPLPSLGEGVGSYVQTNNGGFLRSMNPTLFSSSKSGADLIMQVSSPVVVPAEMGSSVMEILQRLASVGIEKLSMQANRLMPLEDITGKTMQQIAWEAEPSLEAHERQAAQQHQSRTEGSSSQNRSSKLNSGSANKEKDSEYVSLEDFAPLAMDKIEALSMEGLRIQSGMSDEDAPSNINPQSIGDISALEGKKVTFGGSLGLDGAGGLQLLDIKDSSEEVDGLMGLSVTLDEWMRLDSGEIDDEEDQISERTSKILAAHHATSTAVISRRGKLEKRRGKKSGRRGGLFGNNFTVALMVQLRDPLRNYEPVGAPMLALIQVERVFLPPKPKIYSTIFEVRDSSKEKDDDDDTKPTEEDIKEQPKEVVEEVPQFKITEVHVAGLKTEPGKKKVWGSSSQQQSGSRWLIANGMGKTSKHPFMKSKQGAKSSSTTTTTSKPGETLWSISARVHGTGAKWKELAKLNPHIRNPNVILPNATIRLS